jgi:hypothetical protein
VHKRSPLIGGDVSLCDTKVTLRSDRAVRARSEIMRSFFKCRPYQEIMTAVVLNCIYILYHIQICFSILHFFLKNQDSFSGFELEVMYGLRATNSNQI